MDGREVSRRGFLRRSSAALAGAALAGALSTRADAGEDAAAKPGAGDADKGRKPWQMRQSTSTVQFGSLSLAKACERIAALGFEAVDIWHSGFGSPHLEEVEKMGADALKDLLAKTKLKLYAFTCYSVGANQGYPRYAELLGKAGGGVAVREARYGKVTDLSAEMKTFLEQLQISRCSIVKILICMMSIPHFYMWRWMNYPHNIRNILITGNGFMDMIPTLRPGM